MNAMKLGSISQAVIRRRVLTAITLGAMLFIYGCSSEPSQSGAGATYPTGISEDVEQQLKYDARVDSFEPSDGDSLVVNVNEAWLNSPPGMQERSLGQWYTGWHANHSGGVIVQHDGEKVASWTSERGYKPEAKPGIDQTHSES